MTSTTANETRSLMDLLSSWKHNQLNSDAVGVGLSNLYSPYGLVFKPR
jgi:hypothetical protein